MISPDQAAEFERCVTGNGVAVFPSDTVYGLACSPDSASAISRLYELKGRQAHKPSAVMFFDRRRALDALPELGPRTALAFERLLPGPVLLLVPNPADRFPLACGADPLTLGVRVPRLEGELAALAAVRTAVLQSSANHAGGPDARRLDEVPDDIRMGADLVLDGGELPGTASTAVDLRRFEEAGEWSVVRSGALEPAAVAAALEAPPALSSSARDR